MTIVLYGLATFTVIFGGGNIAFALRQSFAEEYRSAATQKVVQTATGLISLLSALALGLLVATAKNKFDTSNQQIEQFATSLMLLNRELVNYGPEADDTKALLHKYTIASLPGHWLDPAGQILLEHPAVPGRPARRQAPVRAQCRAPKAVGDRRRLDRYHYGGRRRADGVDICRNH